MPSFGNSQSFVFPPWPRIVGDGPHGWHPHLMWFAAGGAGKSWRANVEGSPVMAAPDLGDGMTILLVSMGKWSDGTVAPVM